MAWDGQFVFGDAFAAYFGPADDNELHEHAAYQVVLGVETDAVVVSAIGEERRGACFLIRPLAPHAVRSDGSLILVYLDPQFALALDLADRLDADDINQLNVSDLPFDLDASPEAVFETIRVMAVSAPPAIDPRLHQALSILRTEPGQTSIGESAAKCGISESRLRALAREQFGVPLSTWLVWRKLEHAAQALSAGASLAEAALAGGFSDQAHFTRAMRRMFGITPSVAARLLKNEG